MKDAPPKTEAEAEKQLRDEYEKVIGAPPDELAGMICRISAKRALRGEKWHWTSNAGNKNWGAQLNWS